MYCPQCKQTYPDGLGFCPKDGTPLQTASPVQQSFKWRGLLLSFAALVGILLLLFNLMPMGLNAAAANCSLSLAGIKSTASMTAGQESEVAIVLSVYNGNLIPVKLERLHFNLSINGKKVAVGSLDQSGNVKFPARNSTTFEVPLEVSLWGLFSAGTTIFSREQLEYQAQGEAILQTWFGLIRYPFTVDKVNLPVM